MASQRIGDAGINPEAKRICDMRFAISLGACIAGATLSVAFALAQPVDSTAASAAARVYAAYRQLPEKYLEGHFHFTTATPYQTGRLQIVGECWFRDEKVWMNYTTAHLPEDEQAPLFGPMKHELLRTGTRIVQHDINSKSVRDAPDAGLELESGLRVLPNYWFLFGHQFDWGRMLDPEKRSPAAQPFEIRVDGSRVIFTAARPGAGTLEIVANLDKHGLVESYEKRQKSPFYSGSYKWEQEQNGTLLFPATMQLSRSEDQQPFFVAEITDFSSTLDVEPDFFTLSRLELPEGTRIERSSRSGRSTVTFVGGKPSVSDEIQSAVESLKGTGFSAER